MEIMHTLPFETRLEIARRLKVRNKDLQLLEWMEKLDIAVQSKASDKILWAHLMAEEQWEVVLKVLAFRYADHEHERFMQAYQERFDHLKPHIDRIISGKPLISAQLLLQKGIKPGKGMGALLKEAERIAIEENLDEAESVIAKLALTEAWKEEI
jgi:poly(A) polymerase